MTKITPQKIKKTVLTKGTTSPGIDGKAVEEVVKEGVEEMINKLHGQLRNRQYRFSPVRLVEIPKPRGGTRPLGNAVCKLVQCEK